MSLDEYYGEYAWDLNEDNGLLKKFIECECKESLTGDTFKIGKLPFALEAYPNGDDDRNNGSFMLYLTLLSTPDQYKQIIFNLRLFCKETHSSFTSIAIFTSQRNSAGWSQDTVKLTEIKEINDLNQLSIGCNINILKIIDIDNNIIYKYKNPSQITSPITFTWNIDENLMNQFKNCRVGRSFESEIFDKMWCLRCSPNGKRSSDEGNVKLYLLLCSLPIIDDNDNEEDDDSIHVQYTLWCNETETGYNSKIVLDYEYSTVGWPAKILLTPKIQQQSSLTFNAEIEIITNTKKGGDSSDSDDDTYSSSSSYGMKGVIAEDDYDEEEKQDELIMDNDKETPQQPDDNNDDKIPEITRELSPPQITTADVLGDEQQDASEIIAANNEEMVTDTEKQQNTEQQQQPQYIPTPDDKQDIIDATPKSQTPPPPTPDPKKDDDDIKEYPQQTVKKKRRKNKKKLTVQEFKSVSLEDLIENDIDILDNYDIAKKICKFFDSQFDDTDTVCIVAEKDKQPTISYWVKGQYVRKHKNICGKHILVYRACKHIQAKEPILSQSKFESYIKKISIEYENNSVNKIADLMDNKFGDGCHFARSTTKKPAYDIYCRFSDKYECGFKLPSGSYVIAWRR